MTRRRSRAIQRALLAIALSAVISSCGVTTSTGHPGTPSGSVNTGTPSGSVNTGTPSGSVNTGTPSGSVNTGTPSGSVNTGTPSGSVNTGTPSGSAPSSGSPSSHPVTSSSATATSITVPNVDSQSVQEAMQNLLQAGLAVGIQKHEPNLYVPNMSVITTDPAVGSPEPTGFVVNLLVSTGPASCSNCRLSTFPMPNVAGQTLTQAKTTLAEHSLSLQTYSFQESSAPQGEVIQSTPSAGTPMTGRFGVALIISSGPASPSSVSPSIPSSSVSPSTPSSVSPSIPSSSVSPSTPSSVSPSIPSSSVPPSTSSPSISSS